MIANNYSNDLLEYDSWLEKHPFVFDSELAALREVLQIENTLSGIEVGLGTGRYAEAMGIHEGVETIETLRNVALSRGIISKDAVAEKLPYHNLQFDYVLMVYSVCRFDRLDSAFHEANRVLNNNGALIIGFIDKESTLGRYLETRKSEYEFCTLGHFYTVDKILSELTHAGFQYFTIRQTLFGELDTINSLQHSMHGYGKGSFVVIKALKKSPEQ